MYNEIDQYENQENTNVFDSRLMIKEEILWQGKPEKPKGVSGNQIYMLCFATFWEAFSIFWVVTAFKSGAPNLFCVFGMPFIFVGIYLFYSAITNGGASYKKTYYAITNKRILFFIDIRGGQFHSDFIKPIYNVSVKMNKDETGTVYFKMNGDSFGSSYSDSYESYENYSRNGRIRNYSSTSYNRFLNIKDPNYVCNILNQAIMDENSSIINEASKF